MNEYEHNTLRQEVDRATVGMSDHDRAVFVLGVATAIGYAARSMTERLTAIKNSTPSIIGGRETVRK